MAAPPKVCIVTGASRGIGRGIALVLARDEGHLVYATARSEEALQELAQQVARETTTSGGRLIPVAVDHTDDTSASRLVDRVLRENPGAGIDLLVNNAYGGVLAIADNFGKMFWEKPLSVWDASHAVGLRSHYIMCCLTAPSMVQRRRGLVVNISSAGGRGYLFDTAYGAGKACLDRMSADMAVELADHGVHALTLWPGAVNTETTTFPGAESVEFAGRSIGALVGRATTEELSAWNGKIVQTAEVASKFGFTDVDGTVPGMAQAAKLRKSLSTSAPVHWRLDAQLDRPVAAASATALKGFFSGSGRKMGGSKL